MNRVTLSARSDAPSGVPFTCYWQGDSGTSVADIDFALDFLDDASGGVTARYELGYAQGGVFTSWGFVDDGPHEPRALYVTDLSSISGVAPAGSHLALRIVDVAPSAGDMRMFMGSNFSSGVLNVFETTDCPGGIITTTADSVTGSSLDLEHDD